MLVVDPVKRITIADILKHPFFTTDLPRYLTPLPPPTGPVIGALSALVVPPKPIDFEIIEGLGRIEPDVVDQLAGRMIGVSKEEIWECLRRDDGVQGNAVKVAYMLLRDKNRLGKDRECPFVRWLLSPAKDYAVAEFAEAERDAQEAAMDVRIVLNLAIHGIFCYWSFYSDIISNLCSSPVTPPSLPPPCPPQAQI